MTKQVYHLKMTSEDHSTLIFLHYVGTTMARAIQDDKATPAQRKALAREWMHYLSKVEPALHDQQPEITKADIEY